MGINGAYAELDSGAPVGGLLVENERGAFIICEGDEPEHHRPARGVGTSRNEPRGQQGLYVCAHRKPSVTSSSSTN